LKEEADKIQRAKEKAERRKAFFLEQEAAGERQEAYASIRKAKQKQERWKTHVQNASKRKKDSAGKASRRQPPGERIPLGSSPPL